MSFIQSRFLQLYEVSDTLLRLARHNYHARDKKPLKNLLKFTLLGPLCDSASAIPGQTRGEGMQNGLSSVSALINPSKKSITGQRGEVSCSAVSELRSSPVFSWMDPLVEWSGIFWVGRDGEE